MSDEKKKDGEKEVSLKGLGWTYLECTKTNLTEQGFGSDTEDLDLSENEIGEQGVKNILELLREWFKKKKNIKLEKLNVEYNNFDKKDHASIRNHLSQIFALMSSKKKADGLKFLKGNNGIPDISLVNRAKKDNKEKVVRSGSKNMDVGYVATAKLDFLSDFEDAHSIDGENFNQTNRKTKRRKNRLLIPCLPFF